MSDFFGENSSDTAKKIYKDIDVKADVKNFTLGEYNTFHLLSDAKRIGFLFARYKFVAKMFEGYDNVLEIGCQEGLGSLVVAQNVKQLVAVDFYKPHVESCKKRLDSLNLNIEFKGHDMLDGNVKGDFNGAFSLDVFEHIEKKREDVFMTNIVKSLSENGVLILGMPSLESQRYASETSKKGHVNCKSGKELKCFCEKYFKNVFMFAMNDEVVHTGFLPMAHYLLALCVGKK